MLENIDYHLKHIKIFNKNWNYFANMNNDEIEYFLKLTNINLQKALDLQKIFFNLLWNNALDDKLNIFKTTNFKDFKKSNLSKRKGRF